MSERYLILSDLHLCDVEEHLDGWKYFKSSRYHVDQPLADLVAHFLRDGSASDRNILILNGDVFDFDLVTAIPECPPWPVSWLERRCGLFASPEKSVWKLGRVLDAHPVFVDTLTTFIAQGGQVVYVLGNHDREMHFEAVRHVLVQYIGEALQRRGLSWDGQGLVFEPWFFFVPGVLFAEHGNQFDPFTAYRDILQPTVVVRGQERLALPMGNLSNRYLLSRIGRFNPFSGDYIRTGFSYVHHWLRHYAFSRRSLVFSWLSGALLVLMTLLMTRRREAGKESGSQQAVIRLARRTGLPVERLHQLRRLHSWPVSSRTFRVMRQLWLDRLLLGGVALGCSLMLAFSEQPWVVKLTLPLLVCPLAFVLYARLVCQESVFDVRHRIPGVADRIAQLLEVPLVTFGHDHLPKTMALTNGSCFADSGTWAPMTQGDPDRSLAPGYRNFLVVTVTDQQAQLRVGSWPAWPSSDRKEIPEKPASTEDRIPVGSVAQTNPT